MTPKQLLSTFAALLGVVLIWRLFSVESDIAALRSELAKGPGTLSARGDVPAENLSSIRDTAPSSNPTGFERTLEELDQAKDRIAELERTVSELSDAWNQFAVDEENKRIKASMRSWGPEQAVGPPDTHGAGDQAAAWAPASPDGGMEWLQTEYEKPVEVAQVRVIENDGPGAIVKITAVTQGGGEAILWAGEESRTQVAPVDQAFPVPVGVVAQSIRVYLDTSKVPGWNEIDAVELIGRDGTRQWAKSATASSTYAQRSTGFTAIDGFKNLLSR